MQHKMTAASSITISEVADLYGVTLRTLRFYEGRGLLSPTRVGTARYYSTKDKVRLELILTGRRLGFTLHEIDRLIAARIPQAADDGGRSDLLAHLDEGQIQHQLKSLEDRRDAVHSAIFQLREALHRWDEPEGGLGQIKEILP